MAGVIQLETRGSQDVHLTDNPEYTYFATLFKRHTNFSMFETELELKGEKDFDRLLTCHVHGDVGDLLKNIKIRISLNEINQYNSGYAESIGHVLLEYVNMYIGDQLIQHIPSDYMQIYSENFYTQTKQNILSKTIGKANYELSGTPVSHGPFLKFLSNSALELIVDIPFYFHNNPELYFPICALRFQELRFEVKIRNKNKCTWFHNFFTGIFSMGGVQQDDLIKDIKMIGEFICLDKPELEHFKTSELTYLINYVQTNIFKVPSTNDTFTAKLDFMNMIKELFIIIQGNSTNYSVFDYDNSNQFYQGYINYEHLKYLTLELDGETILDELTGDVINLRAIQSDIHHTRTQLFRRYYIYSFALRPESWKPTGHRNFSPIKEQIMKLYLNPETADRLLKIYALTTNILNINKGETRLLYNYGRTDSVKLN